MPDLRRQVLESGKTVSRKAASREGSRRTSRANSVQNSPKSSRNASRNASRHATDDEDAGNLSDDTAASLNSFDDLDLNGNSDHEDEDDDSDEEEPDWVSELPEVIEALVERKRTSGPGREEKYIAFNRLLKSHYLEEPIRRFVPDLVAACCRSIKHETSPRETTLALRALELIAISAGDNTIFKKVEPLLTRTIRAPTTGAVKVGAIKCLTIVTMFGGAGDDDIQDQMTFYLDIVASDGQSIEAEDSAAACVAAVLEGWSLMATEIEDLESESEDAIQIFMDQLTSTDPSVQIAAGENIALLYEKSYSLQESYTDWGIDSVANNGGNSDSDEDKTEADRMEFNTYPRLVKRYTPYHNREELESQLQSLATLHSKHISKRDKKSLHKNFASIKTTVSDPRRGPMYNVATDTTSNFGSRLTVKVGRRGAVHIDRWWKWIRLNALRRTLQGGTPTHYFEGNPALLESLPVMIRIQQKRQAERLHREWASRKESKMRNDQRRAKMEAAEDGY